MKPFLHIAALALCLSAASAFAAATYTRDAAGHLIQVADVDDQGHPQIVEFRWSDDKGRPTKFVYAMRYNGGSWCKVSDPNALGMTLTTCLGLNKIAQ